MSFQPKETVSARDKVKVVSVLAAVTLGLGLFGWWVLRPKPLVLRMIDLASYYNASTTESTVNTYTKRDPNNLGEFPLGTGSFARVPFTVKGLIQVGNKDYERWQVKFPPLVEGIAVNARCRRLHLLHGTAGNAGADIVIALLDLHYANGGLATIPIIYNRHVEDWWFQRESTKRYADGTEVAWRGDNALAKSQHSRLRIYKSTFLNPRPDQTVVSIDYVSALSPCSPFLLGLTVQ